MSVVLVHGAYGAPRDWAQVAASMTTTMPSTAVTLPGHGAGALGAGDHDGPVPSWADAIDVVESQLPPTGALHLVGYSMGARVCLALSCRPAIRRRLRSLTVISATAGIEDDGARQARIAIDDERAASLTSDPDGYLAAFWGLPLFASLTHHPDRARLLLDRQARARRSPQALAHWLRALSVGRQPSLWSALPGLHRPVAVVVGALDTAYVDVGLRMVGHLPQASLTVVADVGHAILIEAPAAVASAIDDVIGRATGFDSTTEPPCAP